MPAIASLDPEPSRSAVSAPNQLSTVAQPETSPFSDTVEPPAQLDATLEALPAEIRREILDALDFESLRSLTHASPIFHQQYRLDRRFLLRGCLERTLGAVAVDACVAYQSSPDCLTEAPTMESVAAFLEAYQGRRFSAAYSILDEALTESDVVAMAAFHFNVVDPLFKRFTSWALGHLASETGGSPHHKPLSTSEKVRVMRAMYRFQLCCNLFYDRRVQCGGSKEPLDVVKLFFCLFEPWEVEEVACIHHFSRGEFDRVLRDIHWDLHPENPKFDDQGRPATPTGAFNFDVDGRCNPFSISTPLSSSPRRSVGRLY